MSSLSVSVPRFGSFASHRLAPIPRQPVQVSLTRRAVPVGSSSASLTSRASPLFTEAFRVTSNTSVVSSNYSFHSTFPPPFSSHARPGDECYSLSLKRDFGATVSTCWKRKTASEDELDVFGAEKYFSGGMDGGEVPVNPWKLSPENEVMFSASWNTQSVPPSSFSESRGPPSSRNKFLRAFRLSCYGKSSVSVNEVVGEKDDASVETTPVSPTSVEFWSNEETGWWSTDNDGDALRHEATDNFNLSQTPMNRRAGVNLKTTKAMQESFTKCFALTGFAKAEHEVDSCSESSSDLFELDNISTITLAYGVAGGLPKGASIDRSVVTAKAAEFSPAPGGWWRFSESARRRHQHQREGGMPLLGCRSRKAVDVSTGAHKVLVKAGPGQWPLRNCATDQTSPGDLRQRPGKHLFAGRRISAPISTVSPW